jgi:uncharacterized protein (DUF1501 family)
MNRRDLLQLGALAAPLIVAGRAFAAPQTQQKLLVVFLRGAYDAANVVIPTSSDFYYAARPTIAVAKPNAADPLSALPLDADWSLHPALKSSIYPLWQKKQVAFVPFAGTDDLTRSHFETQDTIELGQPLQGSRNYGSGFMSRLASTLNGGVQPIAFTTQVPLTFRGGAPIPNIALQGISKPAIDDHQAKLIADMYQNTNLRQSVAEGFKVDDEVYRSIASEMTAANRGAVSAKGFELSARRIGRLMKSQFNLAFVDVGGWDTHVNEGGGSGYLAGRLTELGNGLAGFADEIGPAAWNDTTVVVISEFGRTFRENGNRGTDHGHGSVYWVMGGQVRGGRIVGDHAKITEASLFQNRDWPVTTDYRALFGGLFQKTYGLDQARLTAVFPGAQARNLQLV